MSSVVAATLVFAVAVIGLALILGHVLLTKVTILRELAEDIESGDPFFWRAGIQPYQRAEALLRELLDPNELRQLRRRGYVDIASPNRAHRIYRIPRFLGRVSVYEDGVAIQSLCLQPMETIPSADVVVMHKLMIQGDEEGYLAQANHFPPLMPEERYRP